MLADMVSRMIRNPKDIACDIAQKVAVICYTYVMNQDAIKNRHMVSQEQRAHCIARRINVKATLILHLANVLHLVV